jgi:protein phosphatase
VVAAPKHRSPLRIGVAVVAVLMVLAVVAVLAGMWAQQQYYIGADGDRVTIFQGVRGEVLGVRLQHASEQTNLSLADLPESERSQVVDGIISTDGLNGAHALVDKLRDRMLPECPVVRATPTPAPTVPVVPAPVVPTTAAPLPPVETTPLPSATLTPGLTCRPVG